MTSDFALPRVVPRRAVGFRPWEISALVNWHVLDTHASEAAFLWTQRARAVGSPHYRLLQLSRVDRRIDGHLQGLLVDPAAGWRAAARRLETCDEGVVFVVAHLAFRSKDADRMRHVLQLGLSERAFRSPLVSGAAWGLHAASDAPLERLAASPVDAHRQIAFAARIAHGERQSPLPLAQACESPDAALRGRVLRAIGELKWHDATACAERAEHDPDAVCRFWAGRSLALLGDRRGALLAWEAARSVPALMRPALEVAMRCGATGWSRDLVRELATEDATMRSAIIAVGALGDTSCMPWLIDLMDSRRFARLAGESFAMITGADLRVRALSRAAPNAEETDDPYDEDADLPWPAPASVAAWWFERRRRFPPGQRFIAGHPADAAIAVLRDGYQRQRIGASIEVARFYADAIVFPVRARADWQLRKLAA